MRKIDIHKDEIYYRLFNHLIDEVYMLCAYFQLKTNWGENYKNCYNSIDNLLNWLNNDFQEILAKCEDDFK